MAGRASVRSACAASMLAGAVLMPSNASAHPAGIMSVNRYLGVTCGERGTLRWAFWLDFAEMPARAELSKLDADGDGEVRPPETAAYLDALLERLLRSWDLWVDSVRVRPTVVARNVEVLDGQAGLPTVRVTAELVSGPHAGADELTVRIHDGSYGESPGWRELGAEDSPDGLLLSSSIRLPRAPLAYTDDAAGSAIPRVDDARFVFQCGPHSVSRPPKAALAPPPPRTGDTQLVALMKSPREGQGCASIIGALAFAFALGAGHALSPGHGKALVAAFLVGSRSRIRDAVALGIVFALVHTSVVFAVGLIALTLEQTIASASVLRGLEVFSGLLIIALALRQFPKRWRALRDPHSNDHDHSHHHAHDHEHEVAERRGPSCSEPLALTSLLAMGFSGGAVPCPSALVVLLAAVALHRTSFGVALLAAFSGGLALTLSVVGCLFVVARDIVGGPRHAGILSSRTSRVALRVLPLASTLVVLVLGLLLCLAPAAS